MTRKILFLLCGIGLLTMVGGCSPEVGSEKWCDNLKAKDKGDWTQDETKDYVKNCLLK